jgi:hypothetical protein
MDSNCEPFPGKTIRDWVLGIGEFSEENLRKSRQEAADRMAEKVIAAMQKRVAEAFLQVTNHDAEPAATAEPSCKSDAQHPSAATLRQPADEGQGTGNTPKPVAWAVFVDPLEPTLCSNEVDAKALACRHACELEPLYERPHPGLTGAEVAAIAYAELTLRCETHPVCERHTDTLRALLNRLELRS